MQKNKAGKKLVKFIEMKNIKQLRIGNSRETVEDLW